MIWISMPSESRGDGVYLEFEVGAAQSFETEEAANTHAKGKRLWQDYSVFKLVEVSRFNRRKH